MNAKSYLYIFKNLIFEIVSNGFIDQVSFFMLSYKAQPLGNMEYFKTPWEYGII